ncbi:MAG: carboxypeptidase M32 [Planctomycetales bacterium]|nr:carboxypeptidase M32 [Planctomycetales bacterium]
MIESTWERYRDHLRDIAKLVAAEALLEWDARTKMPARNGEYRGEQAGLLAGIIHQRRTAPEVGEWLDELRDAEIEDDALRAMVGELDRRFRKDSRVPGALVAETTRVTSVGQHAWVEARRNDDFAAFQPHLENIIRLKREYAEAVGYEQNIYDALLDDYEPRQSTAVVAEALAGLRAALVPLVSAITECDRTPDRSILTRHYPEAGQRELGRAAAAAIGFDFDRGRLDETHHPFCTTIGPHDVRLTTRYDEQFLPSSLFGTLHEAGHGIYEQGLPAEWFGLPLGSYASLGVHESQSRLWENLVGRSRAFWEHFYSLAQNTFPQALGDVSLDAFHFAINDVKPSLIRVEADEVTYNLHIIIRFELEQALLCGDLAVADAPGAWRDKYESYLGITPPNDAVGVLQDVHWSAGLIGYFPTYSLGNLYSAQLFAAAERSLGNLADMFRAGEFTPLREWLQEQIYRHGQRYPAAQLVEQACGEPLSHHALIAYLRNRFSALGFDLPPE